MSIKMATIHQYVLNESTSVLKCPYNGLSPVVTWMHNQQVFSVSNEVNKKVSKHNRLSVVGNHTAGEYFLKIKNISDADTGSYVCISRRNATVIDSTTFLILMVPPSNMSIIGQDSDILYTEEGSEVNLTCEVQPGIPSENLLWISDKRTFVNGSTQIQYTFRANQNDHMKVYTCIAVHMTLRKPLIKSIQLVLPYKPKVRMTVYPGNEIKVGLNVTLSCIIDNLFDLQSLTWWKDSMLLSSRSTELFITNVQTRDAGTYRCIAVNTNGEGYSDIKLIIEEFTSSDRRMVSSISRQTSFTSTPEAYDNGKRQKIPLLHIIASCSSFVIFCLLLASTFVIYRRCHRAVHRGTVNPNPIGQLPNRCSESEYEIIDESGILPVQNVQMEVVLEVTTIEATAAETTIDTKSSSSSTSDSPSRSPRPLSDYLNPYCALKVDLTDNKNEYEIFLYKTTFDTSVQREGKKYFNTI